MTEIRNDCESKGMKHIIDCTLIESLVQEGELMQEDGDGSMFSLTGELTCIKCGSDIVLYYELADVSKRTVEMTYPPTLKERWLACQEALKDD